MRAPLIRLGCLLSLLVASSSAAVTIDWTLVGDPGNAADPDPLCGSNQPCGAVPYAYYISTYEVTNAQYAEFLNAKAGSDPLGLYNPNMANPTGGNVAGGGITRSGESGSYTYSTIAARENMPVNWVSFYDALRFANWLHNGQGTGDTETGAYTLLGGTGIPSNGEAVTRNPGAAIFLSSEDEWFKAAYYDALSMSYFDYPTGADTQTICTAPTGAANSANCDAAGSDTEDVDVDDLTVVGSYTGSASPYGTFDQGGNVFEWNETISSVGSRRGVRGGSFDSPSSFLSTSTRIFFIPSAELDDLGFRVAMIPEPGTGLLVIAGLVGLAGWRRAG